MIEKLGSKKSLRSSEHLKKTGATFAGVALILSGCNVSLQEKVVSAESSSQVEDPFEGFEDVYGACSLSDQQLPSMLGLRDKAAEACLDVYNDTDIALVNYSLSPEDATKLASDTADHIARATNNLISPDIVVVPASNAAAQLFRTQNFMGCVDTNDLHQYGAYAAAVTMPELAPYDKIVGVSNAPACTSSTLGVTHSKYNRYADMFMAKDNIQAVNNNNGEYSVPVDLGIIVQRGLPNTPIIAAHEILHGFGLGHSGLLYSNDGDASKPSGDLSAYILNSPGRTINLNSYIATGVYDEYGSKDVMGDPMALERQELLELPQTYTLEWPQRALGNETHAQMVDLDKKSFASGDTASKSMLASLLLDDPLPVPRSNNKGSKLSELEKFESVIFEPDVQSGQNRSVEVFLSGDHGSIISLGKILHVGTHQLQIADKLVTVSITNTAITIDATK